MNKKHYIKPTIEFDEIEETNDLLADSQPHTMPLL